MADPTSSTELRDLARQRLLRALGPVVAQETEREILGALRITEVTSPSQLLAVAEHLIRKGGVFEAVGRGLKVTALLRGAA